MFSRVSPLRSNTGEKLARVPGLPSAIFQHMAGYDTLTHPYGAGECYRAGLLQYTGQVRICTGDRCGHCQVPGIGVQAAELAGI